MLWPENTPESAVVFATLHDRTRPLARETFELETLGMTAWERRAILRRIRQALASHEVAAAISAQQERERQRRGKRG